MILRPVLMCLVKCGDSLDEIDGKGASQVRGLHGERFRALVATLSPAALLVGIATPASGVVVGSDLRSSLHVSGLSVRRDIGNQQMYTNSGSFDDDHG